MKYYVIVYKKDEKVLGWVTDKITKHNGFTIRKLTHDKIVAKMWVNEKVANRALAKLVESGAYDFELSVEEVGVLISEK